MRASAVTTGATVRAESWMGDAPVRPPWPPIAPTHPAPVRCVPPSVPPGEPPPVSGRDVALAVYDEGDELVILLGALDAVDHRVHLRVQDAALEAARVALVAVPDADRGDVRLTATKDHVIVRVRLRSHLAVAVAVARELLRGWKAGAL